MILSGTKHFRVNYPLHMIFAIYIYTPLFTHMKVRYVQINSCIHDKNSINISTIIKHYLNVFIQQKWQRNQLSIEQKLTLTPPPRRDQSNTSMILDYFHIPLRGGLGTQTEEKDMTSFQFRFQISCWICILHSFCWICMLICDIKRNDYLMCNV